jgi:urease accessory protein
MPESLFQTSKMPMLEIQPGGAHAAMDHEASLQRARGQVSLHLNRQKIEKLYQAGCAKMMLPKTYGDMTEAVMLNTAGGITGGDQLDISIQAQNCALVATSQTAERFYKSSTSPARVSIQLKAQESANLHWLPQETILFDGAEIDRTIRLDMQSGSQCVIAESLVLGREAMGEVLQNCHFTDSWRLYRDGVLFHAEQLCLTGDVRDVLAASAGGNAARLLTTIIYAGADAEQAAERLKPIISASRSASALSCWREKLVVRLVSADAPAGRADIVKLLLALRQQPLPRVWQV